MIYRNVGKEILMPEFDENKCETSKTFEIIRSDSIVDFDVVIMFIEEIYNFLAEYRPDNQRRILIIFSGVFLITKGTAIHSTQNNQLQKII